MHRRLVTAAAGGALLFSSLPAFISPAYAQSTTTRVDGDNFGLAGVTIAGQGCSNPDQLPGELPALKIDKAASSPLGQRSVGWSPAGTNYAIGPRVHLDNPEDLTALSWKVKSPSGLAVGLASVTYKAPNDTGTWRGTATLQHDNTKAWQSVQAVNLAYEWRHLDASGTQDQTAPAQELIGFVRAQGGNGGGVDIGFGYGCDGNPFYIDALKVTADGDTETWDFEGYRTQSALQTTKRTIIFGEKIKLSAGLHMAVGDAPRSGTIRVEARQAGAKKWKLVKRLKTGRDGEAALSLMPSKNTSYRTRYAGTEAIEASTSRTLAIKVRPNVRAKLRDASVIQGNTFSVAGRFVPKRAARIFLQKYIGQEWRTQRSGRSSKDGTFSIGALTTRVGKSYWRIKVAAGGGNTWGNTLAMRLITKPKPQPPSDPGPTLPPTDPTPPPEEPPPPPPPGPQRPVA